MRAWFLAIRPKTLVAAVIPVLVGTALASASGASVRWTLSAFALLGAVFIQIATNLFNDVLDFKKGIDTVARLGPVRVTQSGLLSEQQVWRGALVFLVLAILCGIPLVVAGGWVIVVIGLFSLLFAYLYTGGPWPLSALGLGEPFVILFFGLVAVGGVYYLQTETWNVSAFVAGMQVGCLATVLLAVNNLRDVEQDQKSGRKTLPVRFGIAAARMEMALLLLVPFVLNIFWWQQGYKLVALLPLVALPFAYEVVHGVRTVPPSAAYNYFLARAALVQLNFGGMLAVGMFWK